MRQLFLACALLWLATCPTAVGQQVDFDEVVLPAGQTPKTFEEYAIQRAYLNNVSNRALAAEVEIADLTIRRTKLLWLEQVNANINFASQQDSIFGRFGGGDPRNPNGTLNDDVFLRPGFNYGLSFNLGSLVNNKKRVRIAEQEQLIAESKRDQEKLHLRALVKTRLEARRRSLEVLRIRRLSEIDAETNYTLVRELFEQGKANFEDLAQASEVYHRAVEATAMAESNVRNAEILIEEVVGEPWAELAVVKARMERAG